MLKADPFICCNYFLLQYICFLCFSICEDQHVQSAMLYPAPDNYKELLLVGVNAKMAQRRLQEAIQERFRSFSIFTQNIANYRQHTIEFDIPTKDFNVVKTIKRDHTDELEEVMSATCELLLKGRNATNRYAPYWAYYVWVPAHFVLEENECREILESNSTPDVIRHKLQNILHRSFSVRFHLHLHFPRKILALRQPTFLAYRQFRQSSAKNNGLDHFSSFYNDSVLLEIEPHELEMSPMPRLIALSELEDAMSRHQDKKSLGPVLPLRNPRHIATMALKKVCVMVAGVRGHMVIPSFALNPSTTENQCQLHHIQFILYR